MLKKIIKISIENKLIILLITAAIFEFGLFSLTQIPILMFSIKYLCFVVFF